MSTRLFSGFVLVLFLALGGVAITQDPPQASAQGPKQAAALAGDTSGVVSLAWNAHASTETNYFVDITGQRVCALTIADGTTAECADIVIPAGAAVTALNPNDTGLRLFTIGAGRQATQVCAVVGTPTAASTRCTTY